MLIIGLLGVILIIGGGVAGHGSFDPLTNAIAYISIYSGAALLVVATLAAIF